ncbi:MAG TPA: nucleotidyl transferase AbiEii/AbiGii toxin family protein [bacterium]|nr:nucleotidyl transferase AbiEii/AbiGii toxin family protein [bacterium]
MRSPEMLLAKVMNHLADRMKDKLVLKGGMLLRLHNSPRSTQDVDYVWITKDSKKGLAREIEKVLTNMEGIEIESTDVNPRGVFVDLVDSVSGERALLEMEVSTSTQLPAEPMSTGPLGARFALGARIIATMALPEAFAHKIVATLERDVARDLYDLSQMQALSSWDEVTLNDRLGEVSINRAKPKALTPRQAAELLSKKLGSLDQKRVEQELHPLLPAEYRAGVLSLIRAGVTRIIDKLSSGG